MACHSCRTVFMFWIVVFGCAWALPPLSGGPRKPSWKDHPIYRQNPNDVIPPILAWFTTKNERNVPAGIEARGYYLQQGSRYVTLRHSSTGIVEGRDLYFHDMLGISKERLDIEDYVEFETTRESRMCLILNVPGRRPKARPDSIELPRGFRSFGVAQWNASFPHPRNHKYSSSSMSIPQWGHVACRTLRSGKHKLPSSFTLSKSEKVRRFAVLFSEVDMSAPPLPVLPPRLRGLEIKQHQQCPEELHRMWTVESHDYNDKDLESIEWLTWHPQRDYLFNCYYGHEHGLPGILMNYTERYHYTALKNNMQKESHRGFAGYVLPAGRYNMYLNLHANTEDIKRVNARFHTLVIAMTDKRSGELQYEMSCKADFGGSGAKRSETNRSTRRDSLLSIGNRDTKKLIYDLLTQPNVSKRMKRKRINVYNPWSPDPRLHYNVRGALLGVYEIWTGGGEQYCMRPGLPRYEDGITIDIHDPRTACGNRDCTRVTRLGKVSGFGKGTRKQKRNRVANILKALKPNLGVQRVVKFRNISIAEKHCRFALPANRPDGVFYTDQYCREILPGPGPNAVRQVLKPSFKGVTLSGQYGVTDVHGHNMFKQHPKPPPGQKSTKMHGFAQDQGALGILFV